MKSKKFWAMLFLACLATFCFTVVGCSGEKETIVVDCGDEIVVEYGVTFSVPDAKIVGADGTELQEKIVVSVTDADGENVSLSYNSFIPEIGNYTILFSNESGSLKKTVVLKCEDSSAPEIVIDSFRCEGIEKEVMRLPVYKVSDLSGVETNTITLMKNGQTVTCDKDGYFTAEVGEYKVLIKAKDKIGNETEKSLTINVYPEFVDSVLEKTDVKVSIMDFNESEYVNTVLVGYGSTEVLREHKNGKLELSFGENCMASFMLVNKTNVNAEKDKLDELVLSFTTDKTIDKIVLKNSAGDEVGRKSFISAGEHKFTVAASDFGNLNKAELVVESSDAVNVVFNEMYATVLWSDGNIGQYNLADFDEPEYLSLVKQANGYGTAVTHSIVSAGDVESEEEKSILRDVEGKVLRSVVPKGENGGFIYRLQEPLDLSDVQTVKMKIYIKLVDDGADYAKEISSRVGVFRSDGVQSKEFAIGSENSGSQNIKMCINKWATITFDAEYLLTRLPESDIKCISSIYFALWRALGNTPLNQPEAIFYVDSISYVGKEISDKNLTDNLQADFDETFYLDMIEQNINTIYNLNRATATYDITLADDKDAPNGINGGALKIIPEGNSDGVTVKMAKPFTVNELYNLSLHVFASAKDGKYPVLFFGAILSNGTHIGLWTKELKGGWNLVSLSGENLKSSGQVNKDPSLLEMYVSKITIGYHSLGVLTPIYLDQISYTCSSEDPQLSQNVIADFDEDIYIDLVQQNQNPTTVLQRQTSYFEVVKSSDRLSPVGINGGALKVTPKGSSDGMTAVVTKELVVKKLGQISIRLYCENSSKYPVLFLGVYLSNGEYVGPWVVEAK